MRHLAREIRRTSFGAHIFNERQLATMLATSDASRYGLVNRALKDGSIVRLKRGTYALGSSYRSAPLHPFAVAQALAPGSYISFESALAYHGWIPEAVFVTAGVTPGRKSAAFETTEFGSFRFHPLAIEPYGFLAGVDRVPLHDLATLVAQPLRALMDLVALRKQPWVGLDWLVDGMRIEEDLLLALKRRDFTALQTVYKHKSANAFLTALEQSIGAARREAAR